MLNAFTTDVACLLQTAYLEFFDSFAETWIALAHPSVKLWDTHVANLIFVVTSLENAVK